MRTHAQQAANVISSILREEVESIRADLDALKEIPDASASIHDGVRKVELIAELKDLGPVVAALAQADALEAIAARVDKFEELRVSGIGIHEASVTIRQGLNYIGDMIWKATRK